MTVLPRTRLTQATTTTMLVILVGILMLDTADKVDSRLVSIGEHLWSNYALQLRRDPSLPLCDPQATEELRTTCVVNTQTGSPLEAPPTDDPFGQPDDPFATPDDPFGDGSASNEITCTQAEAAIARCNEEHIQYRDQIDNITPSVRAFRAIELFFAKLVTFSYRKHLLSVVLLLGGLQVTRSRAHIALRRPKSRSEFRISQAAQLLAHVLLSASALAWWQIQDNLTVQSEGQGLAIIWSVGFAVLAGVNTKFLIRPPTELEHDGDMRRGVLSIPLYAFMVILSGLYFWLIEGHPSGQAIYLGKFVNIPTIYLAVALYIWAGMLLERSQLPSLFFGLIRNWGLPPLILGWCVVVLAAIPTAYSGASGIFVIAAGAVIFGELRKAGATAQDAMMFTAMSGSLGVVLRPCLVVVLIAVLNHEVTTEQLFQSGKWVFSLTAIVLFITIGFLHLQASRRPRSEPLHMNQIAGHSWLLWSFIAGCFLVSWQMLRWFGVSTQACMLTMAWFGCFAVVSSLANPSPTAASKTRQAAVGLLPYLIAICGIIIAYRMLLDTPLNEQTAHIILPVALLTCLGWERFKKGTPETQPVALTETTVYATKHATKHTGALLFLMGASVCLGGVIERLEIMSLVPESFGSAPLTMAILVVIMVFVGMIMDAMGAVILVSVTLADVAYRNGIDPVHFWMMVLVAFELGYLTPPVSLNHLLARQVIGTPSELSFNPNVAFTKRYRHILIPMMVMSVSLLIVAFVPFLW